VDAPTPASLPWHWRRVAWHAAGLVLAALVTWLVLRGYRQPEFLLDLSNLRLC
jgi:hypothetical protein